MNKVMSLHDAVARYIQSGDTICFGGFTTNRKPYAAMYEILRQGQTDFTVWAGPAGGDWDMMIGEGRVKAYINCYTANSGYTNVSRRFRAFIEQGKLTYENYSQDVLMLQFHAASLGLPFLPVRLMQGSGLMQYWGISPEKRKEMPSVDDLKAVEMENPFAPGEKVVAVPVPRLDSAVIHVQKASPDGTCIIEGDEFHDVDIAVAAKRVIVTCEELVSDEYIRRDPTVTKVFGACVDAVVHVPFGAWPSQCYNYYDCDGAALKEYDKTSKYQDAEDAKAQLAKAAVKAQKAADAKPEDAKLADAAAKAARAAEDAASGAAVPETFRDYLAKWVYTVQDNDALLNKIGGARLAALRVAGQADDLLRGSDTAKMLHIPLMYILNCSGVKLDEQEKVYPNRRGGGTPFYRNAELNQLGVPVIVGIYGTNPAGGGYHSISPTILIAHQKANMAVGGAGPTRDHIENLLRLQDLEGAPRCEMTTPNQFFRDLEDGPLPPDLYVGELYFAAHRGVYTSQAKVKQGNRRSEFALREADVWTALLGARNDAEQERWYKLLMFNQFHDVLPGSGIAEIYQQARSDYDCILRESRDWLRRLLAGDQPDAVTAFNSMGWNRTALLRLPEGWTAACGDDGPLPVQSENGAVYARVNLQPFSASVLRRADASAGQDTVCVPVMPPVLENDLLTVRFAADGSLESVYDKALGREWLEAPGNCLRMYRDIPRHFDAWDIDSITFENPVPLEEPAKFLEESHGPPFSRVRYRRRIGHSMLEQTVTLETGSRQITFETQVDWNETHKLLKAKFPFALHAEEMVNEIRFGFIRRPTHASRRYDKDRFEVCSQKWSAIAQADRGAAVLNDGKYGIRGTGGTLSLSLLRAPKAPDFHADIGLHQFTYAVTFWNGALADSAVVRQGYELNQPVLVMPGARPLPSLLAVSGHGVIIDTVKPAEDGDGIVVRAYQSMDLTATARFTLALPAAGVTECTMLEQPLADTDFHHGRWHAVFAPFQVRSFHVRGIKPVELDQ